MTAETDDNLFEKYRKEILRVFADTPFHDTLIRTVDWLEHEAPAEFGFDDLVAGAGLSLDEKGITICMPMANALCGSRMPLLDVEMRYKDDDGSLHRITEQVDRFSGDKFIPHPVTGERLDDYASRSYLYFTQRADLARLTSPSP